jgi:mannose-6-phosphate isomerase-like protein (cupin superfamily)
MPVVRGAERPIQDRGRPWAPLQKTASAESGTTSVALWRNWARPGEQVRRHSHDVEEVILVVRGRMVATLGDETHQLESGDALVAPAGVVHGFANPGPDDLEIAAAFPSAAPETFWADEADLTGLHLDQLARRPSAAS